MVTRWVAGVVVFFQLASPGALASQGVSVSATVTPQPVAVNDQFVVNVEISGTQQLETGPKPPTLGNFAAYLGSGRTTSMRSVNGRTTVALTIQYRFRATKVGTFTVPAIPVSASGTTLLTEPVDLTVTQTAGPRTTTSPDGRVIEIPADALFVTATPSKRTAYVNEPVIVEYRIYTQLPIDNYRMNDPPSAAGFWIEALEGPARPQVENVVRDGRKYATALIGRRALFPTGAGTKTIAPVTVEAQVRIDRRSRDPFDVLSGGFFAQRVPVALATEAIPVAVRSLPSTGRPAEFTGFVGDLRVDVLLDKNDVRTNEALTYRLALSGEGNLQTLPEPSIDFPEAFEVYPPEMTENIDRASGGIRGTKTYEYVLIPRVPGLHTIPAARFGYFDADAARYETAAADAIPVSVTGDAVEGPLISIGGRGAVTTLRQDIRFIRVATPNFIRRDRSLFGSAGFWLVALVPLSVLGAAVGVRRHQDRLAGDVAFARGRRASRTARRHMTSARSLIAPDQAKVFHAQVARALRGFLGDKLNVSEAGMVQETIRTDMEARGVAGDVVDEYFACLDLCDRYRFAPVDVTIEGMKSLAARAEQAMTGMERALK